MLGRILHPFLLYISLTPAAMLSATPLDPSVPNASLQLPANLTSYPWQCWPKGNHRLMPTTKEDCRLVAEKAYILGLPGRSLVFGTDDIPSNDIVIPLAISAGSCKIRLLALDRKEPHVSDTFSPRHLAHMINRLAQQCVEPSPHLGGEAGIGAKQLIGLVVAGFLKPESGIAEDGAVIE